METELVQLKKQINPHFLFNNLNNLYAYALENSPKTPTIILELSSLLRYMLYDCKSEQVKLASEIDYLRNYIDLQQLKKEEKQNISPSLNPDDRPPTRITNDKPQDFKAKSRPPIEVQF